MAKSFVERPKIPSMTDISKDIEEAQNDDVVFHTLNFVSSFDGEAGSNGVGGTEEREDESENSGNPGNREKLEKLNTDISQAYLKAVQMVKLCEILREAPSKLEHEYKELENQGLEVSNAIEDLKRSSQTIPTSTSTKSTQKKKKGKK